MQTRASCARKSSRRRNCTGCVATTGSAELAGEPHGRGDERVVVGAARALHLEVEAVREAARAHASRELRARRRRCPAAAPGRRRRRARRTARSARRCPRANHALRSSARPRCWLLRYARVSQSHEPAGSRARLAHSSSARNGGSRSASCVSQTSQPTIGLMPRARAARVELDEAEDVREIGQRERRHRVGRAPRAIASSMRTRAVDDRELAVQAQVDEAGRGHGRIRESARILLRSLASATVRFDAVHPAQLPSTPRRDRAFASVALVARSMLALARLRVHALVPACATVPHAPPRPTAPPLPRNAEPPPPPVNLSGFPLPYRQGYADGCASATGAERKDAVRFRRRRQLSHRLAGRPRAVPQEVSARAVRAARRPALSQRRRRCAASTPTC